MTKPYENRFLWTDLETTGINHSTQYIIELAAVVTDGPETGYKELGVMSAFAIAPTSPMAWEPVAREMHEETGLLDAYMVALENGTAVTYDLLDTLLSNMMTKHGETFHLAGRNVMGFDHRFIVKYLPKTAGMLHYRAFDVTTFRLSGFEVPTADDLEGDVASLGSHRAMYDIRRDLLMAKNVAAALGISDE